MSTAVAKNLARKRIRAFAKVVLRHPQLSRTVIHECAHLGSTKTPSILLKKSRADVANFDWKSLVSEWENRAPTLLLMLSAACDKHWSRMQQTVSPHIVPPLCMGGAVLMKCRNKHMSGVQTIISILLNAGHVSSQVHKRRYCGHVVVTPFCEHILFLRPTHD